MPEVTVAEIQNMMKDLSDSQKSVFISQYESAKKDRNITLVLSVLLGGIGVDRFMIGDIGIGILKLLTFGLFGIFWFIDLFLIRGRVDEYNRRKAMEVYHAIKMSS